MNQLEQTRVEIESRSGDMTEVEKKREYMIKETEQRAEKRCYNSERRVENRERRRDVTIERGEEMIQQ